MNLDVKHYIHKAKWIDDSLCDEVITTLDNENNWLPFPKDVVGAYPGEERPQDGIVGSSLSIDWEQFIGDPNIPEQDRNYGLAHLKNQIVLDKVRASMRKGLDHYVHKHLKDIEWYDYYRDFTDPKFMKYQPTHDMQLHCDHVGNAVGGKGIPTVSMVGCLNDDYKGGYLRFFEDAGPAGSEYWLSKGDIIYFPSNFLYPHRVTEVTKGLRYSFVSWVW
jgi:hypothetical protein|tara:strand:+ start:239 stop:895 length:657 start_codon:yes stop_codon:yes gene_type:complete